MSSFLIELPFSWDVFCTFLELWLALEGHSSKENFRFVVSVSFMEHRNAFVQAETCCGLCLFASANHETRFIWIDDALGLQHSQTVYTYLTLWGSYLYTPSKANSKPIMWSRCLLVRLFDVIPKHGLFLPVFSEMEDQMTTPPFKTHFYKKRTEGEEARAWIGPKQTITENEIPIFVWSSAGFWTFSRLSSK